MVVAAFVLAVALAMVGVERNGSTPHWVGFPIAGVPCGTAAPPS